MFPSVLASQDSGTIFSNGELEIGQGTSLHWKVLFGALAEGGYPRRHIRRGKLRLGQGKKQERQGQTSMLLFLLQECLILTVPSSYLEVKFSGEKRGNSQEIMSASETLFSELFFP